MAQGSRQAQALSVTQWSPAAGCSCRNVVCCGVKRLHAQLCASAASVTNGQTKVVMVVLVRLPLYLPTKVSMPGGVHCVDQVTPAVQHEVCGQASAVTASSWGWPQVSHTCYLRWLAS